jgi:hypothetical protein
VGRTVLGKQLVILTWDNAGLARVFCTHRRALYHTSRVRNRRPWPSPEALETISALRRLR